MRRLAWKNIASCETLDGALSSSRGYSAWHLVPAGFTPEDRTAKTLCGRMPPDASVRLDKWRDTPPEPRTLTREERRLPLWCRPVPVKVCKRCLTKHQEE